ncbi:MAG: Holliday junction branch migration protein RuvA [Patescibacteria group bacterium]|nr:Holliday junction branch migration protein RuvA [Patescibacteria group bacterium]
MIAYLRGKVKYKNDRYLILDVAGVGYQVYVTNAALEKIKSEDELELYTFTYIREDAHDLYGFLNYDEKEFFEQLIGISKVGPKGALGILNVASLDTIKKAIIHGDPDILTKVSGVGKKTAERVVMELKNKIDVADIDQSKVKPSEIGDNSAIDALVGLGYSATEAREALREVDKEIVDVEKRIKEALKILGQNK